MRENRFFMERRRAHRMFVIDDPGAVQERRVEEIDVARALIRRPLEIATVKEMLDLTEPAWNCPARLIDRPTAGADVIPQMGQETLEDIRFRDGIIIQAPHKLIPGFVGELMPEVLPAAVRKHHLPIDSAIA